MQHSDLYSKIKEARRQEDPNLREKLEEGSGGRAKKANFTQVAALAQESLSNKSKDLWLAVWLCDALVHEEGLAGLRQGLEVVRGLVENFWDSLYPKLDEGDPGERFGPLDWLGDYFDPAKGSSPIYSLRTLSVSELAAIASEEVPKDSADLAKAKSDARKQLFRKLAEDVQASQASLLALDTLCKPHFPDKEAPSFDVLGRAIEEINTTIGSLLETELTTNPDAGGGSQEKNGQEKIEPGKDLPGTAPPAFDPEAPLTEEVKTSYDAMRHITAASRYLQRESPGDPMSYLLIRALRWGELRGADNGHLAELLEAPAAELRMTLKKHAVAGNWGPLLEAAEAAMCTGCGRGWLDLQRYVITACEHLGYTAVGKTLRSELKQLLADLPQLATATLLDDTGAANPDTAAWLRKEGYSS